MDNVDELIMRYIFLGSILIPVILLVVIGMLIKYRKAYWLISGYNTMSAEKKKNVDIEGLGKFVANVCFLFAGLILAGTIFIYIGKASASMIIFALIVPSVIYILIKAQKFDGNTRDKNGKMKTGTKVLISGIAGFLILVSIGVGVLLYNSNIPAEITIKNDTLNISGMYGQEIALSKITEIEIKDYIPEIIMKTNGSNLGSMLKGHFKLNEIGKAKLFVNTSKKPFVYLNYGSEIIIFNCEDGKKTEEIYNTIKKKLQLTQ